MRNALSMANKAVQKINEDDMSSRPKWKKTQNTVDSEKRDEALLCRRLHNTAESKEVISCSDPSYRIQNQRNNTKDNKATNHSRRLPGSVSSLSGVRSPLKAKIRPSAPLSGNVDHLRGLPVILTYASMLGAAAVILPAPMLVFITAEPHFDEDMSKEQGLFYFLIAFHTCLFVGTDTKYPPRMLFDS